MNKYKWKWKHLLSEKDDWKKFEENNVTVTRNVLYAKKEEVYPVCNSKNNSNHEKTSYSFNDSKRRKTMALSCCKKLSALLRGITSNLYGDFYCLNCFHSFRTKNKLEFYRRICENKDFCEIIIPSEDTKILEFNQFQKSDKVAFIVYVNLECLIEKIDECKNKSEDSSTTNVNEQIPSGFSISTISLFRSIGNKHDVYIGKDCNAMKLINFKKKKMK